MIKISNKLKKKRKRKIQEKMKEKNRKDYLQKRRKGKEIRINQKLNEYFTKFKRKLQEIL